MCTAAVLLFWNLDERYLWQDEASTAVLAVRMLETGKPLCYDGVNLLANDNFAAEDLATLHERTRDPAAAVAYYVERGDMKADTAWIFQPWGQFVVAAASFLVLGETTFAARLPFAAAALATVLLLYRLVRRSSGSPLMAALASALLSLNAYWILHGRQCRYYALSGLFLVLTLMAYLRWQRGERRGAALFVLAAWCWFQVDYGLFWPTLGVLFADAGLSALRSGRRRVVRTLLVGATLGATLFPFVVYYELWGRRSVQLGPWAQRFEGTLFNLNEYCLPLTVLLAAAVLLALRWKRTEAIERRLVAISCVTVAATALWVPSVAPDSFVRYLVAVMPLGSLLAAWLLVRGAGVYAPRIAWLGAAVLALTPWLAEPAYALISPPPWNQRSVAYRQELGLAAADVFGQRPDPNRLVVEWLREHAAPDDEILINYEDIPLMFYLENPIRGGIAAFRVEDDARTPPRFAILRTSVSFVHWPVFQRELARYRWEPVALRAPDVVWGNNPDPMGHFIHPAKPRPLQIARRRGD